MCHATPIAHWAKILTLMSLTYSPISYTMESVTSNLALTYVALQATIAAQTATIAAATSPKPAGTTAIVLRDAPLTTKTSSARPSFRHTPSSPLSRASAKHKRGHAKTLGYRNTPLAKRAGR